MWTTHIVEYYLALKGSIHACKNVNESQKPDTKKPFIMLGKTMNFRSQFYFNKAIILKELTAGLG